MSLSAIDPRPDIFFPSFSYFFVSRSTTWITRILFSRLMCRVPPIRVSTYGRVLKVDSRHENKRKSLCTKSRSRLIYLELYKMMGISWGVRWSETGRFVRWRRNGDGDTNIPLYGLKYAKFLIACSSINKFQFSYRQLLRLFRSLESNYILIDYSNIKHKFHLTHFSYFSLSF